MAKKGNGWYEPRPIKRDKHMNMAFTMQLYIALRDYAKSKNISMNELVNRYISEGLVRDMSKDAKGE